MILGDAAQAPFKRVGQQMYRVESFHDRRGHICNRMMAVLIQWPCVQVWMRTITLEIMPKQFYTSPSTPLPKEIVLLLEEKLFIRRNTIRHRHANYHK